MDDERTMTTASPDQPDALLRRIPAVDEVLASARVQALLARYPRWAVRDAVREALEDLRRRLRAGDLAPEAAQAALEPERVAARVEEITEEKAAGSLRRVINATGVVLHTNLGRAPLAEAALQSVLAVAGGYSNLEFDLATGERGSRQAHVERLLCDLTGAEAALAVNNNAAALFLGIRALAAGREVVISRGEMVEIGDAFRIPDVMTQAGGRLREVGTTNRTHLRDYEAALTPETALLLKVHRSNFRLLGFTAEVEAAELVALARRHGLPVMEDLGSGALLDLAPLGLRREPLVAASVQAGVDLVTFSGDKLLGGPQAGCIVGRRELVARLRRHPVARTVRLDKLCLASLESTLRLLRDPEQARREIPVLRMLGYSAAELGPRAEALASALRVAAPGIRCRVEDGVSEVGGGALPLQELPTRLVVLEPGVASIGTVEARLRRGRPPALVRIKEGCILLDPRTLLPGEEADLVRALAAALAAAPGGRAS
jgi:L-seryl-tRNA(Ser) seleniumtransferase